MATNAGAPNAMTKLRRTLEIALLTLGTLISVGVSVLFLALPGANRVTPPPSITTRPADPAPRHTQTTNETTHPNDAAPASRTLRREDQTETQPTRAPVAGVP
jgi:hypothetical protein